MRRVFITIMIMSFPLFSSGQADSVWMSELDTIRISSLTPISTNRFPLTSFAIDSSLLHDGRSNTLGDVLTFSSGMYVKDYGGAGGLQTVSHRGLSANFSSILINGVRLEPLQSGQVDLSGVIPLGINEIEISKFSNRKRIPVWSQVGSVSIDLKLEPSRKRYIALSQKNGSFGLNNTAVRINYPISKKLSILAVSNYLIADNDYTFEQINGDSRDLVKRTNSQVEAVNQWLLLNYERKKSKFILTSNLYKSDRNLPGAVIAYRESTSQTLENNRGFAQLNYSLDIENDWTLLSFSKISFQQQTYTDPFFLNSENLFSEIFNSRQYLQSIVLNKKINKFTFYVGQDVIVDEATISNKELNPLRIKMLSNTGAEYETYKFKLNGGMRYIAITDKPGDDSYNRILPALSFEYFPNQKLYMLVSYQKSFRLPTFGELYTNLVAPVGLRPEVAHHINGSVGYSIDLTEYHQIRTQFSVFQIYHQNRILAIPGQNLFIWSVQNIGETRSSGAETRVNFHSKWSKKIASVINFDYTKQYVYDVSESNTNQQVPYTPYDLVNASLTIDYLKQFSLGYYMHYNGFTYFFNVNKAKYVIPDYTLADVIFSYHKPLKNISLDIGMGVKNAFNTRYEVVKNFPMPGRNYFVQLSIQYQKV